MDNFFTCNRQSDNFERTPSRGKSFKLSEWSPTDTYNNDKFIQDWVTYKGVLYACVHNNTNKNPLEYSEYWLQIIDPTNLNMWWDEFEI